MKSILLLFLALIALTKQSCPSNLAVAIQKNCLYETSSLSFCEKQDCITDAKNL